MACVCVVREAATGAGTSKNEEPSAGYMPLMYRNKSKGKTGSVWC